MINKLLEYIGFENFKEYSIDILDFYFKPKKFYKKFFVKDLPEKILQIIYYSILIIALGYILIDDITIKELAKATLYELLALFWIIISLVLSELIISKLKSKKPRIQNIILFTILAKLLIAPLQLVFFGMFLFKENYNYLFLSNLIVLLLTIYIFFFSAILFNSKNKFILLNIALNLIFINFLIFFVGKLSMDDYAEYEYPYGDRIITERLKKGNVLEEIYTVPTHKIFYLFENKNPELFYLFSTPFDTISTGSQERSRIFKKNITYNLTVLDSTKLKFKRNEKFFNDITKLNKKMDSALNQDLSKIFDKLNVEDITEASQIIDEDSVPLYKKWVVKFSEQIIHLNDSILYQQLELEELSRKTNYPIKIQSYLFPFAYWNKQEKTHPNPVYKK